MLPQWYKRHGEAFLSRIVTGDETWFFHSTPENKVELMTWELPFVRQSKRSSRQCGLQEKWWLLFLCCLWSSSGWFATSQFNSKCSCLPGNSQKSEGGYLAKETRLLTEWVLVLHCSAQPHSAVATVSFLNSWSWEVFPHPPCRPDMLCQTSICSQRWKSTSESSASTPVNMFKMKLITGYVPRTRFCVWRTWQIYKSLWYVSKQTLWLCGEVKLI